MSEMMRAQCRRLLMTELPPADPRPRASVPNRAWNLTRAAAFLTGRNKWPRQKDTSHSRIRFSLKWDGSSDPGYTMGSWSKQSKLATGKWGVMLFV